MSKPIKNSTKTILVISAIALVYFLFTINYSSKEKVTIQPQVNNSSKNSEISKKNNINSNISGNVVDNNLTNNFPNDIISNSAPNIIDIPNTNEEGFDPSSIGIDMNNIPDDLPEDLRQQILNPPEIPDDLKAQLEASTGSLPPDIIESLNSPAREITIDEVNKIPGVNFENTPLN